MLEEGDDHEQEGVGVQLLGLLEAGDIADQVLEDDADMVESGVQGGIGSDEFGVGDAAEVVEDDFDFNELGGFVLEFEVDDKLSGHGVGFYVLGADVL